MPEWIRVELAGQVPGGRGIEFLYAEMHRRATLPLVRIVFSINGVKQEDGCVIDLDKEVFIYLFRGPEEQKTIFLKALPKLVIILHHAWLQRNINPN